MNLDSVIQFVNLLFEIFKQFITHTQTYQHIQIHTKNSKFPIN